MKNLQKLDLKKLKVKSFVTEISNSAINIQGGSVIAICYSYGCPPKYEITKRVVADGCWASEETGPGDYDFKKM
ncbi:MAG: pinensin family lanthipeptide [Bacteroidota bacterium]